jgi:hypothetical protein
LPPLAVAWSPLSENFGITDCGQCFSLVARQDDLIAGR